METIGACILSCSAGMIVRRSTAMSNPFTHPDSTCTCVFQYSVGPSIRPMCTRCCLVTTNTIQVCSDFIDPEYSTYILVRPRVGMIVQRSTAMSNPSTHPDSTCTKSGPYVICYDKGPYGMEEGLTRDLF